MTAPLRDRRRTDRETSPPGAVAEAAIVRVAEQERVPAAAVDADEHRATRVRHSGAALLIATIGVVYGDIGTSPLYAFRQAYASFGQTQADVFGLLSLITWSLILVVAVKYLTLVMRADDRGEGGILVLLALLLPGLAHRSNRSRVAWIMVGLFGASLLYGDGIITPAISVLSAVEGLKLASHTLDRAVVPLTLVILVGLFCVQRWGTGNVGRFFGPVMVVWFVTIAWLGAHQIWMHPSIVAALSPVYSVRFFAAHGWAGFTVLGAVVLVVTGAEALYADMGHFGKQPIRLAWFALVLPALLLNYLGQGALVLSTPHVAQPFFELAPRWAIYPMVGLASVTTIIASQAIISGAFSLTRQLMHLGYSPALTVLHTSDDREGQVYVPAVNWLLLFGCLLLVVSFGSSDRLAAAYGLAVSGTMALTTALFYRVMRTNWRWPFAVASSIAAVFLTIDLAFVTANLPKIRHGGWLPLVIGIAISFIFVTWRRGRARLLAARRRMSQSLDEMIDQVLDEKICRTPGAGVFLSPDEDTAPACLRQYVDRIHALHENVVIVTVKASPDARVSREEGLEVTALRAGFIRVIARYGYIQSVSLEDILLQCERRGACVRLEQPTYYLAREQLSADGSSRMARWRKLLFIFLHRNAPAMQDFLELPRDQVLEIGLPIEI